MSNASFYMTDCPYKGLFPYEEEDRLFFFGRETWRKIITDNLITWRLTILSGGSGVGKSSVLRAGVVHDLHQSALENAKVNGKPGWATIVFPPLEEQEDKSEQKAYWQEDSVKEIKKQLAAEIKSLGIKQSPLSDLSLVDTLEKWTEIIRDDKGLGKLFIILDQFEEYFFYNLKEFENNSEKQNNFADEFSEAVNRSDLPVNFLISIQENDLAKIDYFKEYIRILFKQKEKRLALPPLNQEEAEEAIKKPINQYNLQQTIINSLMNKPVTVLYGEENVGKSFVLKAGIAHRLPWAAQEWIKKEQEPNFVVVFFDASTQNPVKGLKQKIKDEVEYLFKDKFEPVDFTLELEENLEKWIQKLGNKKLLIIIDQVENHFPTRSQKQENAPEFANKLKSAVNYVNQQQLPVNFLFSVRADSQDQASCFREGIDESIPISWFHLTSEETNSFKIASYREDGSLDISYNDEIYSFEKKEKDKKGFVQNLLDDLTDEQSALNSNNLNGIETSALQRRMTYLWEEMQMMMQMMIRIIFTIFLLAKETSCTLILYKLLSCKLLFFISPFYFSMELVESLKGWQEIDKSFLNEEKNKLNGIEI